MPNWDIIKGQWSQLKGQARTRWGKLTDDEWEQIAGHKDRLVGKLQEKYGWTKEEAEREADSHFDQQTTH
ncbi:MAG: CsbD family protein [Chloroflexota bacterium]